MSVLQKFELSIAIDQKSISIVENGVMVNHAGGKERQMVTLFFRAMLAVGISPHNAAEAMGKVAATNGYTGESQGAFLFDEESLKGGGCNE